ncbi:MAG: hypothetical protein WBD63_07750 [Phycisphaerae bacterium]|nr:hypothetical protein [Phycisphaerae bacterium]
MGVRLGLFQAVVGGQVLGLGLDEGDGDGLGVQVDSDAEGVVNPALGAFGRPAVDDFDGARGFLAFDKVFGPTTGVDGGVYEFGTGIGFAKRHAAPWNWRG